MLDAMSEALANGHRIEIRGFGSFGLNRRPSRVGRNPKSGEKVLVPEKFVPHFKRARNCANVSMAARANRSRRRTRRMPTKTMIFERTTH